MPLSIWILYGKLLPRMYRNYDRNLKFFPMGLVPERPKTHHLDTVHMSQEQEKKDLDDYGERIKKIIVEDREILDELA